ncbi:MAG: MFS transporter [Candidatus Rokubacteria bacterium]|nr:MFS transporter [Candidatus Rokubacteria bacterium]
MRLFYGWIVAAGAFLVLLVAYGAQYSFGLFFSELVAEFGWSRAALSGVFSLYAFAYPAFGFPAGRLTDLWGPRVVIALGGILLGLALAGMALVSALWQPYVLYGLIAGMGMSTAWVPCNATIVKWFVRRRGAAVGLVTSGASVGTFAVPPIAYLLIAALGWRGAYVAFGATILVVLNLIALVMRPDPESLGLHPDGARVPAPEPAGAAPIPVGRAMRTSAFWLIAGTFMAVWIPVFIPLVHMVVFARDLGFSALAGAAALSALGVGSTVGRIAMGALSDVLGRKPAVMIAMAVQVVGFVAFTRAGTLPALYTAAFIYGFGYAAISTLFAPTIADFFGRARAGTLVGVLFALSGSASGLGPILAGLIYDRTGSYTLAWELGAALNLLGLALFAACRPPRAIRP